MTNFVKLNIQDDKLPPIVVESPSEEHTTPDTIRTKAQQKSYCAENESQVVEAGLNILTAGDEFNIHVILNEMVDPDTVRVSLFFSDLFLLQNNLFIRKCCFGNKRSILFCLT